MFFMFYFNYTNSIITLSITQSCLDFIVSYVSELQQ